MINAQLAFKVAAGLYCLSFAAASVADRRRWPVWLFLLPALFANAAAVALRYRTAWPMLPMYLGPVALPLGLGGAALLNRQDSDSLTARRFILVLTMLFALLAVCFPKDFYLPFLKSQALPAHLFFIFGVVGKGCFLVGAAWAMAGLCRYDRTGGNNGQPSALSRSLRWTVWGFFFWTLSMFAGELWTYLGWGMPVIWDDPVVTTTMATWFFYTGLLHLHLTGSWNVRGRNIYATAGALVILGLNSIPDLGPFHWPL